MVLLQLDPRDNVAIAVRDLNRGQKAEVDGVSIEIQQAIRRGHKVALTPIARGGDVVRYGEVIGEATRLISSGEHVHVHNVIGKRLPGAAR